MDAAKILGEREALNFATKAMPGAVLDPPVFNKTHTVCAIAWRDGKNRGGICVIQRSSAMRLDQAFKSDRGTPKYVVTGIRLEGSKRIVLYKIPGLKKRFCCEVPRS